MTGATYHVELAPINTTKVIDPKADLADPNAAFPLDRCFGHPYYGPRGAPGKLPTNRDLDECHGLVSKVWWDGRLVRMYHHVITAQFPYTLGCFRGTPVRLPRQFG